MVLHPVHLQLHRGKVVVAYLELHLNVLVVVFQVDQEGLRFQDEMEKGGVGILQGDHLLMLVYMMLQDFLEVHEIQHFDRKVL